MNILKNKWLLFYINLCWLSQENMVRRVFGLKKELLKFYIQKNHHLINLKLIANLCQKT